jgi:hypothetical protein
MILAAPAPLALDAGRLDEAIELIDGARDSRR